MCGDIIIEFGFTVGVDGAEKFAFSYGERCGAERFCDAFELFRGVGGTLALVVVSGLCGIVVSMTAREPGADIGALIERARGAAFALPKGVGGTLGLTLAYDIVVSIIRVFVGIVGVSRAAGILELAAKCTRGAWVLVRGVTGTLTSTLGLCGTGVSSTGERRTVGLITGASGDKCGP